MIPVALDTETALIERGCQFPPLACVSVAHASGAGLVHHSDASAFVARLLSDPRVLLVGHNIAFDLGVLIMHDPGLAPLVFAALDADRVTDTMIRAKLADTARGQKRPSYSLEGVSGKKLDKGDDGWRLRYGELRDLGLHAWPERARAYALEDARTTLETYHAQETKHAWCLADQFRRTRANFALKVTSANGLRTDPLQVQRLRTQVEIELRAKRLQLQAEGLIRPDRTTRTGRFVPGTKNRKAALDRAGTGTLQAGVIKELGDPALDAYAEIQTLETMLSKDLTAFAVSPIHTYFDPLLITGRTSSSRPNVQNVRKVEGFREIFVPRPGFSFVDADYSGLELATLAEVCVSELGRSSLADELNAGISPHDTVAADILGESVAYVQAHKKDPRVYDARQLAKAENFGLPGGLGAARFCAWAKSAYGIEITEPEARARKARWLQHRPEMRDYFAAINGIVESGEPLRHLYSDRYRGAPTYTQACNSLFQGLGADVALDALYQTIKAQIIGELRGCFVANFVHDEILIEAPAGAEHEAAEILTRIMVDAGRRWLRHAPLGVEVEAMSRWSKSARAVRDARGRLIPWTG